MAASPSLLPDARQILKLARSDKRAATAQMAALSLEEQSAVVCSAPLDQREKVLDLTPHPEEVIPLMPEAEFCFTAKAIGLWDAGWLVEHATEVQLVTSFDLDGWQGLQPDVDNMRTWLAALAQGGDEVLVRAARSLDAEVIVLMLRERVEVFLDPKDEQWEPPPGAQTLEGMFYLLPKDEKDDLSDLLTMLHALFREDYWLYFRMMQGVIWELESDLTEWALRWRTARLEDLGFPSWDEAMRIYGYIRPGERARLPDVANALDIVEWQMPVHMPELPASLESGHSVFRAASELEEEERRAFFYGFIATANKVAIADRMPLGDPDTLPEAIESAASVVSSGLDYLARENAVSAPEVLRRVPLERLFRVGASLEGRKPPALPVEPEDEADPTA